MVTKTLNIQNDGLKRLSIARPEQAITELIWNSLDADASKVDVSINLNAIPQNIVVTDNGLGINHEIANMYLDKVGGSWKQQERATPAGKSLHGQKGEGRFKVFSIGRVAVWETVYEKDNALHGYSVSCKEDSITEVDISEEVKVEDADAQTGTTVVITELHPVCTEDKKHNIFTDMEKLAHVLTVTFAPFLISYTDVEIIVNGQPLNPSQFLIDEPVEIAIDCGNGVSGSLKIIFWNDVKQNNLYFCKGNGAVLSEYLNNDGIKIKASGYKFSAYFSSELFTDESIGLAGLQEHVTDLIHEGVTQLNKYLSDKKRDEQLRRKDRWLAEGIYPYKDVGEEHLSPIDATKRNVFDIVAVAVEENLNRFKQSSQQSKRFTFKLMAQALEENPASIQKIMTEVLNLSVDEQKLFAELLNKTSLSFILKSAKVVIDRLAFLDGLEDLIFNHKKTLLERDQLHKILNEEAWVFDENFTFAGPEKRLNDVLNEHIHHLGKREDDIGTEPVLINEERQGRVDLMFSKVK